MWIGTLGREGAGGLSVLSWLDFSEAERQRALELLDLLATKESRDELGLGTIRDAFADAMFPGISTLQQRARYFLFVPWLFREVERLYTGSTDVLERARQRELRLIQSLIDAGEVDGVIGSRSRAKLQQVPSIIYWQGLRRWGIRTVEGTREQWARSVSQGAVAGVLDDDNQLIQYASWWHSSLPDPPERWPTEVSLALTRKEGEYLRDRVRQTCGQTLLATLVERSRPWEPTDFPWELRLDDATAEQRRIVAFARRVSQTMHGAALLYNHMLAVATGSEDLEEEYRNKLEAWAVSEAREDRSATPLPELWVLLDELGCNFTPKTRTFIEAWFQLTADPREGCAGDAARELIRGREWDVKGPKARLISDAARETWRGAAGAQQLSYRWRSAQRQILDILEPRPG